MQIIKRQITEPQTLYTRMRSNDQKAFKQLFDLLWSNMYNTASALVGNPDEAKDVVQEVFINLWKRRGMNEIKNIEAYCIQSVRFKSYNYLRDRKLSTQELSSISELPAPVVEELELKDLENRIDALISLLPTKRQRVFLLSRQDQLTNQEIADKLGLSKKTVETHITHALRFLREHMNILLLVVLGII